MFEQRPAGPVRSAGHVRSGGTVRSADHVRTTCILARALALAAVALCTTAAGRTATAQQPITLDDIRELPGTPWLGLSPDGDRLAYLLSTPGASADLWLVPFGGGTHEQLTHGIPVRSVVGWSAGADRLAFVAPDDDHTAMWLLQPAGEPRVGCALPRGARSAAWMGDGVRLTFAAPVDALQSSSADTSSARGDAVFTCDPRSGTVSQVTARGYYGLEFAWSPLGDRLAISFQERAGFYERLESDLFLVDVRTGEVSPLVTRPGVDRSPLWSPDGTEVAFLSAFGRSGLLPNIGVAVIRPGEASPRDVGAAHDRGGFFESPALHAWSADSRSIFYSVVDGLEAPLFRVPAAGGTWERVPVPAGDGEVAYQFSLSADPQRLAFKVSATDRPPEIFTMRLGHTDAVRVTQLHDGFTARGATRAERLRWAAPDSTIIEGMLLRPPPSAGDGPFPLVTILHGGPASAYNFSFPSLGFFNPYQDVHLAARGYAVFLPNPRGSGGYGAHFRRAARRDWGDGPATDVHAGIDTLVAMGVADPGRLALMGWSYGGYLAAWMLAHSDRFAVGSVGAGVYDLTTHYGLGAPQLEEYFGGPPWRLPGLYRQQSPIQHVARIRTPTQIIHGENDNAVSIAQSELLHAALLAEGVPTEFVRYPGEGHSLRQPAAQNDSWQRMLTWLERWITTGGQADAGRADTARDTAGDDVATLDGIINAYYDVISGPAGSAPDRVRDHYLHHPDALVAITSASRAGTPTIRTMSLDEYHELFGGVRTDGFYEREIHRRVERFGNIAHVWSTYESSRESGGTPFTRGINSIQLYNDGQRWWITSWVFDSERSGNPIPGLYLPGSM